MPYHESHAVAPVHPYDACACYDTSPAFSLTHTNTSCKTTGMPEAEDSGAVVHYPQVKKKKKPNKTEEAATNGNGAAGAAAAGGRVVHFPQVQKKMKRPREESGQQQPTQPRRQHTEARQALPIWRQRSKIVETVRQHASTILVGETGSGKSTQVPQFLLDAGFCTPSSSNSKSSLSSTPARKMIACTQPRRVAAVTVAGRVAEEVGCALGQAVGYAVRFDDKTSARTVIKYMTDGVLLREAMADPLLTRYGVVVLDEAHERSLQTDILFGLIRRAQRQRSDLRVVVMSATLEVGSFQKFFEQEGKEGGKGENEKKKASTAASASVGIVRVEGRQYGVDVYYCNEAQEDSIDAACLTVLQIHESEPLPGDILVFLSGQEDIEALAELLNEHADTPTGGAGLRLEICLLFAALPPEQQLKAFRPPRGPRATTRKVILATNIAETSVTINGIRHVVDAGWVKVRRYVPSTGLDSLKVTQVARAQAQQRAGRAGREAPGTCYRLYTEPVYEKLDSAPEPEILRVNLAQVVLQLLAMGVEEPQHFDYLSPPSLAALDRAFKTLYALGCVTDNSSSNSSSSSNNNSSSSAHPIITPHGRQVASLPLDPTYAHFVLRAAELNCLSEALTAVSMLSAENVLYMPSPHGQGGAGSDAAEQRSKAIAAHRKLAAYDGDVPTLVNIYEQWLKSGKDNRKKWCWDHFVNARALEKAQEVREQLVVLVTRLGLDPTQTCGNEKQLFLRCLAASLFLNIAKRQPASAATQGKGCYKTMTSGKEVVIHPSSVLHGRNPPPEVVVYTEVLTTSRAYIRGVTIADPTALQELCPEFYPAQQQQG